jgi:acyl carrier protein
VNTSALSSRILQLLVQVAPDVDPSSVDPTLDFRQQFDFDSMDTLHFAIALHEEYSIDIPERDYKELRNLAACCAYVERSLQGKRT